MSCLILVSILLFSASAAQAAPGEDFVPIVEEKAAAPAAPQAGYIVGINDVLDVNVLQPETLQTTLTVSPDGTITFPYIGNVTVKGKSLMTIQYEIQTALGEYMKYPLVAVSLRESRSRQVFVYGEVAHSGAFPMQDDLTVMRAISLAGGFTKYGSASKVKILRTKPGGGSETLKVDLKKAMDGDTGADVKIQAGDIVTVSEGVF